SERVDGDVTCDPVEPRCERDPRVAVGREPTPSTEEHLGDRILVLASEPEPDQPGHRGEMGPVEISEGIAISVLCPPDQDTLVLPPVRLITLPIEPGGRDVRGRT